MLRLSRAAQYHGREQPSQFGRADSQPKYAAHFAWFAPPPGAVAKFLASGT